jgi:hypothetical protein
LSTRLLGAALLRALRGWIRRRSGRCRCIPACGALGRRALRLRRACGVTALTPTTPAPALARCIAGCACVGCTLGAGLRTVVGSVVRTVVRRVVGCAHG